MTAILLALYGGVALLLSSVGLYALQLHATRQRRRELGVRLALGASPRVAAPRASCSRRCGSPRSVSPTGLGAALLAGRALERLLFGVGPADPLSLGVAIALFAACSAMAAIGPARHAAAVDPMTSLRSE